MFENDKQKEEAQEIDQLPTASVDQQIENVKSIDELEALESLLDGETEVEEEPTVPTITKDDEELEGEDDPEGEVKDAPGGEVADDPEGEVADAPGGETPIDDDTRKRFNIPEKFKTIEAYSKWGYEAEKAKSKAEAVKAETLRELEKKIAYQEGLLAKEPEAKKEMSAEEKELINSKFLDDFNEDPAGTLAKVLESHNQKLQQAREEEERKNKQQEINNKIAEEESSLKEQVGEDNYLENIQPRLKEIAIEYEKAGKPLYSINDAYAIYNYRESKKNEKIEVEAKEKKVLKKKTFTEEAKPIHVDEFSVEKKIENAKSIEELEALEKFIK